VSKFLFYVWGVLGLLCNLVALLSLLSPGSIGVGTSAYNSALTLIWIGGMIFFAASHLMQKPNPQPEADDVLARVR
jgi:hypothetical protein